MYKITKHMQQKKVYCKLKLSAMFASNNQENKIEYGEWIKIYKGFWQNLYHLNDCKKFICPVQKSTRQRQVDLFNSPPIHSRISEINVNLSFTLLTKHKTNTEKKYPGHSPGDSVGRALVSRTEHLDSNHGLDTFSLSWFYVLLAMWI